MSNEKESKVVKFSMPSPKEGDVDYFSPKELLLRAAEEGYDEVLIIGMKYEEDSVEAGFSNLEDLARVLGYIEFLKDGLLEI